MKLIKERVYDSDVFVLIADNGEIPLLVAGDYKQTMTIKQAENQWMIDNGYERVAGVNCGFFNMSTKEMLSQCLCDWSNIKSSETGYEDGVADIAFDGSKIVVGDIANFKGYQWVRGTSWGIMKEGKEWNLVPDSFKANANSYQPRTMIGKNDNGQPVLIVVDGRNVKSKIDTSKTSKGITRTQQIELAKRYKLTDCVNADGGGSSVMEYQGDIINTLSDGSLRKCSDFVILYRKKEIKQESDNMTNKVLVLDAGHGVNTAGKRTLNGANGVVHEWTMNNSVCNKITDILKNYNVTIKRVDDTTGNTDVSLANRVKKTNEINPDLFVSIHHNANTSVWGNWGGTEVYWHSKGTQEDKIVATLIAPKLASKTGLRNRGVKQAAFAVLGCNVTAVLVEGGFQDSTTDYPVITSTSGQQLYAEAVAESIIKYLGLTKVKNDTVEKPVENTNTNGGYYRVVCGSYQDKNEAIKHQAKLTEKGFESFLAYYTK